MHAPIDLQMPTPCPSSRAKSATAPLDAAARARLAVLPGSADSSGSEHEPAAALSSLVNEYLLAGADDDDATVPSSAALQLAEEGSDAEDDEHSSGGRGGSSSAAAVVVEEIKGVLDAAGSGDDLRRRRIFADVVEAMRGLEDVRAERSAFRRAVMSRLRECGHDAGLCKARWDKTSTMAAGSYEYIDVVDAAAAPDAPETARYIVDVGFAREFEVARPTEHYEAVRAALPEVLVATPGDVRKVVRAASAAVRRSLKRRGLSVPPWRKRKFMLAKWLGPYRRTVNAVPASAGTAVTGGGGNGGASGAVCRTVLGFVAPPLIMASPALSGIDVHW
ncbi:hypothetical protein GUJ93_ZPchr0011g28052 [Zizania palustris]|uniref:Uncharacterized protein n=1 Tax=Zizania palustris TaxID=103762 RepID=A0A8J5WJQ3_ZIZPA|nr:hypothetical protein GUJ93_ZPchr0011g28052 [Zizania palustris]